MATCFMISVVNVMAADECEDCDTGIIDFCLRFSGKTMDQRSHLQPPPLLRNFCEYFGKPLYIWIFQYWKKFVSLDRCAG